MDLSPNFERNFGDDKARGLKKLPYGFKQSSHA